MDNDWCLLWGGANTEEVPVEVTIDQVVQAAARAAYGAVFHLDAATGAPQLDDPAVLDDDAWAALQDEVRAVLRGSTPQYLHTVWLRGMVRQGWAHGPIMSAVHRRSPEVTTWSELPAAVRARKQLFVNVVRAFAVAADES